MPSEHDIIASTLIGDEHGAGPPLPVPGTEEVAIFTKRRLGFGFWFSIGWLVLVIGLALLAPILPLAPPDETLNGPRAGGFTAQNPLGTDDGGRDLLSRTIWGSISGIFMVRQ